MTSLLGPGNLFQRRGPQKELPRDIVFCGRERDNLVGYGAWYVEGVRHDTRTWLHFVQLRDELSVHHRTQVVRNDRNAAQIDIERVGVLDPDQVFDAMLFDIFQRLFDVDSVLA